MLNVPPPPGFDVPERLTTHGWVVGSTCSPVGFLPGGAQSATKPLYPVLPSGSVVVWVTGIIVSEGGLVASFSSMKGWWEANHRSWPLISERVTFANRTVVVIVSVSVPGADKLRNSACCAE